jgi:hypothetical protein
MPRGHRCGEVECSLVAALGAHRTLGPNRLRKARDALFGSHPSRRSAMTASNQVRRSSDRGLVSEIVSTGAVARGA